MKYTDLGIEEYQSAWDYQEKRLKEMQDDKQKGNKPEHNLIFCEHPHVFTLGRSGAANNLLINEQFLKSVNATYVMTNRGGDITYHGPGQIVGYPIFDLEQYNIGVRSYIEKIENAIINTLQLYNIEASRLEGATGVWLDAEVPGKTRKICAIGVRVSRQVTMHGFALNVNTDLKYFSYINPCGFVDKGVTSMQKELGKAPNFEEVKKNLKNAILSEFGI